MNQNIYCTLTAVIFLVIAILHATRLLLGWEVAIGEWTVPMWLSSVALLASGFLAYSGFSLAKGASL